MIETRETKIRERFEKWMNESPHRAKYLIYPGHPVALGIREGWNAAYSAGREDALEEAKNAVCPGCADNRPIVDEIWHKEENGPIISYQLCKASRVRSLSSKKEGSNG